MLLPLGCLFLFCLLLQRVSHLILLAADNSFSKKSAHRLDHFICKKLMSISPETRQSTHIILALFRTYSQTIVIFGVFDHPFFCQDSNFPEQKKKKKKKTCQKKARPSMSRTSLTKLNYFQREVIVVVSTAQY